MRLTTERIFLGFFVILIGCLFVSKLGYTALESYDEAWYGEISRNIINSRNPFKLSFNGTTFTDHPPLGFILMAIPTLFMGSNEVSVRLASALAGVGSLLILYQLGKHLVGSAVGISAVAVLISSMWFVFRVRSGNLDVLFIFWEVLTMHFLVQVSEKPRAMYGLVVSFAALVLTKTLVGFGLVPVLGYVLWSKRQVLSKKDTLNAGLLWLVLVMPWYFYNQILDASFFKHHFFEIGARGNDNTFTLLSIQRNLSYLAIGIGKWYKLWMVSVVFSVLLTLKSKTNSRGLNVVWWWGVGFLPFLLSSQTEIWHLLPLYPVVALGMSMVFFELIRSVKFHQWTVRFLLLSCFVGLAVFQFRQFSNLLYFSEPRFSAERDISIKAKKYQVINLMETFYPAAVYYSERQVNPLHWHPDAYQQMVSRLSALPNTSEVFIIGQDLKSRLLVEAVQFKVIAQNESYFLISADY